MTKEQVYIDFIIDEIKKGNIEPKNIISQFCIKFQKTERTFWNYWDKANEAYLEAQQSINELKAKEYTEKELERHRKDLIDRDKAIEMQANVLKLMYNKISKTKDNLHPNDVSAFNSTMERYSKLMGIDQAKKIEQTNTVIEVIRRDADSIE